MELVNHIGHEEGANWKKERAESLLLQQVLKSLPVKKTSTWRCTEHDDELSRLKCLKSEVA